MLSSLGRIPTTSARSLDLLVEALQGVGAVRLGAALAGEAHVGERVGLAAVHERGELSASAQLVGDAGLGLAGAVAVELVEGLADRGGDDGVPALRHVGERVPDPVERRLGQVASKTRAIAALRPRVGARDRQLDAEAAGLQPAQELDPRQVSASEGPSPRPMISRRPSVLTATAIMAATETILPPWRTLR
jgi:hypothetical protein